MLLLLWRTRVADWLTNQSAVRVALIITFKSPVPGVAVAARRPVKRDGTR